MLDYGIININKPEDFTSFDVVAKLRGILKIKKIGHTGTLDPMATGVLPVCVGRAATRLVSKITDTSKEYETVMLLGVTTDTQDITGNVLSEKDVDITIKQVQKALDEFTGDISQIPPMYSAKKKNGKRLYELAREGIEIEREPVNINISSIEILEERLPRITMRIACSKGTYIRTLCHDIGNKLGCGACMEKLVRISVGSFKLENTYSINEIEEMAKRGDFSFYIDPATVTD